MDSSSRFAGNNNNNSFSKGNGGYQGAFYQRPVQQQHQVMMTSRPQVPHYQQSGDHMQHQQQFRRAADGGATFRGGRGGFSGMMTRGNGYSRPEPNSRNAHEEVRGGRFDNRTQQYGGDRDRMPRNYEGGASSLGRSRPTTNRLREQHPEMTQRPQTQRGPAARREERSRDKVLHQHPPRKQGVRGEDKENKPVSESETQRAPRGRSQETAKRRPSREKSEFYKNNPNFIRVGQKKMTLYIFLMKQVFVETPH